MNQDAKQSLPLEADGTRSRRRFNNPANVAASIFFVVIALLGLLLFDEYFYGMNSFVTFDVNDGHNYQNDTEIMHELYRQWVIRQNIEVFEWQMRSTKVLFWVSILVTICGIGFAFWQFVDASTEERSARSVNEMEVKSQIISLAFKSRSIAALVLFVSIAYFIVYVTLVYPVKDPPTNRFNNLSSTPSQFQPPASNTSSMRNPSSVSPTDNPISPSSQ